MLRKLINRRNADDDLRCKKRALNSLRDNMMEKRSND